MPWNASDAARQAAQQRAQQQQQQQQQRFRRNNQQRAAKQMSDLMARTRSRRSSRRKQDIPATESNSPAQATLDVSAHGARSAGFRVVLPLGFDAIVGRTEAASVQIDDSKVSRRHARLVHDDRGVELADLGSTNGTKINGRRITEPTLLYDGDTISFGAVSAVLRTSGPDQRQREGPVAFGAHDGEPPGSGPRSPQRRNNTAQGQSKMKEVRVAQQLVKTKDYLGAIRVLEPYVQDHPHDTEALNLLGFASFESKQFVNAESAYIRMARQVPNDVRATYGLGVTLLRLGRLEEAETWLTATLAIDASFDRASERLRELRAVPPAPEPNVPSQVLNRPPPAPRPLSSFMIPESDQERDAYRKWSREKARIDKLNDQWYGLPWAARALQVIIGLAIVLGIIFTLVAR